MGKNKGFLLVDGYNIIFAWSALSDIAKRSLGDARQALLDILSDYKGSIDEEVIVIFDAHNVSRNSGFKEDYKEDYNNIKVVYTKEKETADNYIEKISTSLSKEYKVRVATSDNLEQIIILSKGCYRVSARELEEEVRKAKEVVRETYINNKPVKKNMLSDNLDKKTRDILEQMRRNDGGADK